MSTSEGPTTPRTESKPITGAGFPWIPVLTTVGIAAAALFLLRRLTTREDAPTLEAALDQCDRAASALDERIHSANGVLAG